MIAHHQLFKVGSPLFSRLNSDGLVQYDPQTHLVMLMVPIDLVNYPSPIASITIVVPSVRWLLGSNLERAQSGSIQVDRCSHSDHTGLRLWV